MTLMGNAGGSSGSDGGRGWRTLLRAGGRVKYKYQKCSQGGEMLDGVNGAMCARHGLTPAGVITLNYLRRGRPMNNRGATRKIPACGQFSHSFGSEPPTNPK